MICKLYGLVDLIVALIIALMDIPIIGKAKWLLVLILVVKGLPSLWG